MKKILAFGASTSSTSINKKLANFAAHQVEDVDVQLLDLNDFEMPIFSVDKEKEMGSLELANQFKAYIRNADGIVISFAEHNGNFSAAYKNVYDWVSRIEQNFWLDKPMFLLATSPGGRGGKFVLEIAKASYGRANKNLIASFSLPSFNDNFIDGKIVNEELLQQFNTQLAIFKATL